MIKQPQIADLAVISDRRTCALTDRDGIISWYCPGRFDGDALMPLLIDEEKGGYWAVTAEEKEFAGYYNSKMTSVISVKKAPLQQEHFLEISRKPLFTRFSFVLSRAIRKHWQE